jgi:hypothetical protein
VLSGNVLVVLIHETPAYQVQVLIREHHLLLSYFPPDRLLTPLEPLLHGTHERNTFIEDAPVALVEAAVAEPAAAVAELAAALADDTA